MLKSYGNVRFYRDLYIEEDLLKEKSIIKIEVQGKKNPILIQEEKEPIFDFDETKDEEIVVLNESSHKAPDSEFTSPDSDIEETMQV